MKIIRQKDSWSCLACSAAMAAGKTLQDVIDFVGHDGSDWDPNSRHPEHYQGFSMLEIAKFLLDNCIMMGFYCINPEEGPIEFYFPIKENSYLPVEIQMSTKALVSVQSEKMHPNVKHMVYWDGEKIYDPTKSTPRSLSEYIVYEWWPLLICEEQECI